MPEAVLKFKTDGGREAIAVIQDLEKALAASQQRIDGINASGRQRRARGAREERRIVVEEAQQTAQGQVAAYRGARPRIEREEQLVTRSKLRELALREEAQKQFASVYQRMEQRATALLEAEVGKRGALTRREQSQVHQLALAMTNDHIRAERQRTAETNRESQRRVQIARETLSSVYNIGRQVAGAYGAYGDTVREAQQRSRSMEFQATQIAAGDIGDRSAAPELLAASRRVAEETGIAPEQVLEGLSSAQSKFSQLGTRESRGAYIQNVLPMLARASVATGTSLPDMIDAAGEYQRQFQIGAADLPQAIASAIGQGQLGSITFRGQAAAMGTVGGLATRFLSSDGSNGAASLAATGALFQFAGRAGGSDEESATRVRAFLTNFTSARGQRGIHDLLGRDALNRQGQIVTREGESQPEALARLFEEAFQRSAGNRQGFVTALAGNNVRSQPVADQLYTDMQRHAGRATDFRQIMGAGGRVDDLISRPAEAVLDTAQGRINREQVRQFYREAVDRQENRGFDDTRRGVENMRREHPFLAFAADNPVSRGLADLWFTNLGDGAQPSGAPAAPRPAGGVAASRPATPAAAPSTSLPNLSATITDESANRIARALATELRANPPTISQQDVVHAATVRTTPTASP